MGLLRCAIFILAGAAVALQVAPPFLPVLLLFTRFDEGTVLTHPTRRRLFDAVCARPGVSPQELVETAQASWSTVMHHVRVLERHGLVVAVRDGRHRRCFEAASGRWANGRKHAMAALCNPTTATIARMIRDEPGIVQRRIARVLDLAPSSVNWHVRRLERVALVVRRRDADRVRLVPGAAWQELAEAAGP